MARLRGGAAEYTIGSGNAGAANWCFDGRHDQISLPCNEDFTILNGRKAAILQLTTAGRPTTGTRVEVRQ